MTTAAIFGTALEIILPMTDTLTVSDAATNLVVGTSGLSGGKNLTLPAISQMVASQNLQMLVVNKSSAGGTITIVANSADSIVGATTCAVSTGRTCKHDGRNTWYVY